MAAIAYPTTDECVLDAPRLRVVRPRVVRRPSRPSAAVYRRRRLAALLVGVLAIVGTVSSGRALVGAFGGGPLTSSEPPAISMQPAAATTYVVRPGDTLWTIARALHPSGDLRPLVDRLAARQHGRPLLPGQPITVP